MGGLDGPQGAQQESTVPGEDKFEGQLVPQVWMARDNESNLCSRNQGRFIWTLVPRPMCGVSSEPAVVPMPCNLSMGME